jgi:hypothetical protein
MRGMRRVGGLLLAVVLGASLVACGGGDDDDDAASEDTDVTTTEASGSDDTSAEDVDLGDFTGECADFAEAFANAGSAIGSAFSGTGTADDLEALGDYFAEVGDQMPDEIKGDFEVFADAYTEFAQAMADADIDFSDPSAMDPEQLAQLEAVSEAFSAPEVQEASDNISAYMEEHCGG